MASEQQYQDALDRLAALLGTTVSNLAGALAANPQLGEDLVRQLADMTDAVVAQDKAKPVPPDRGTAALAGIGPDAAADFGGTRMPTGVEAYDETITSERIVAVGDLYYLYQHERIGVFRVVRKLQELFNAGAVRLSDGPGAYGLYKFDRRGVLRYTQRDRLQAYRRVLGYGSGPGSANSRPNTDFHRLFSQFANQVTLFWRDKRISDVIRLRAQDPSFGSIAVVRRSGLDLRNNLKFTSFGHLNVLRVEVMQVLDEAFAILNSDDIKSLFGAVNAWDVVDEVLLRYFDARLVSSPRQRMAETGRDMLRWLGAPHVLEKTRVEFEALLLQIAESADEWQISAESLGLVPRSGTSRVLPWDRTRPRVGITGVRPRPPGPVRSGGSRARARANGRRPDPALS